MIKNVFIKGCVYALFVPNEIDYDDDYGLFEALQAQSECIELLEEQNGTLLRKERVLLNLLEMSAQSGRNLTDSLLEIRNLLLEEFDDKLFLEVEKKIENSFQEEEFLKKS